jgi:hypothetical protein
MKHIATKRRALTWGLVGGLALLLLSIGLALAAGESVIQRDAVGRGGGQVSGGGLSLHSAIGQPVVGAVGEDISLCSGYLCGPGAPAAPGGAGDVHIVYLPFAARGN